ERDGQEHCGGNQERESTFHGGQLGCIEFSDVHHVSFSFYRYCEASSNHKVRRTREETSRVGSRPEDYLTRFPSPWLLTPFPVAGPIKETYGWLPSILHPRLMVWRIFFTKSVRSRSWPVTISAWPAIPSLTRPRNSPRPSSSPSSWIFTR